MEIRQFRVLIRTSYYERAVQFYGDALSLPKLDSWDREYGRATLFQAGSAVLEILGPPGSQDSRLTDERFEGQGPKIKLTLVFDVLSAQKADEEIRFRHKNIPGGLRKDDEGRYIFETHDPDGNQVIFREVGA